MSRQARKFPGFKYHVIERPYFSTFLYKILFRGPDVRDPSPLKQKWVPGYLPKAQLFELQKFRQLHGMIRDRARELSGKHDFRFRQDGGLNVYMFDQSAVLHLASEFENHVLGIWGPLDDVHVEHAVSAPKILVKEKLWKGRYRYKIVLRPEEGHSKALSDLLSDHVMGEDYDANRSLEDFMISNHNGPYFSWQSGEKMLYCNDEGLIMMINLVCTDAVYKIDKVITHNELSQQEKIAAQDARAQPGKQT